MGFSELETFNIALLAKMTDRDNKEPDALCVKVIKGLYYQRGDFRSARNGGRASWASIMKGRDVLVREGVWVI